MGKTVLTVKNLMENNTFYVINDRDEIVKVKVRVRDAFCTVWSDLKFLRKQKTDDGNYIKTYTSVSRRERYGYHVSFRLAGERKVFRRETEYSKNSLVVLGSTRQELQELGFKCLESGVHYTFFDKDDAQREVSRRERSKKERKEKDSCSRLKEELISLEKKIADINARINNKGRGKK